MNSEDREGYDEIIKLTPAEISLSASVALFEHTETMCGYFAQGGKLIMEIIARRKNEMEWDKQTYKEIRSMEESIRSNIQVYQLTLQQFLGVTEILLDVLENRIRSEKAVKMIDSCIESALENVEAEIGEKMEYLNGIHEEED